MIGVGLVTLNRLHLLRQTVNSIRGTAPGAPLAVVDNGSSELTLAYLRELAGAGARIQCNGSNLGTGYAKNQAVALLPKTELLCVADNDAVFLPGWVDTAADLLATFPEVGVLGLWKHPFHRTLAVERRLGRTVLVRDQMPGVAWVVRRSLWEELGGMVASAPYTFGVEDSDFVIRVQGRGLWAVGMVQDLVDHIGHMRTDGVVAAGSDGRRWVRPAR